MCRISVSEFTPRDFPESVYEIWNEAFGDSRGEIAHILSASSAIFTASVDDRASAERSAPSDRSGENFPDEENTRADEDDAEDSHCAGMLCTFTVSLNGARGAYIYAVCTRRRYRGMGVMRTLLTAVLGILRSRGMSFAFLVPARREYFPMYEKLGFDVCVPGLSGTPGCGGVRTAVGHEEFDALRPTAFDGDFDRLYSLYLSSPQASPTKGKALFRLSLEEYADGGICYTRAGGDDAEPDGYVIFEPNSKKSINILEIRRCYGAKRGIIDAGLASQVTGADAPPCGCTAASLTDSQKCPCKQAFLLDCIIGHAIALSVLVHSITVSAKMTQCVKLRRETVFCFFNKTLLHTPTAAVRGTGTALPALRCLTENQYVKKICGRRQRSLYSVVILSG